MHGQAPSPASVVRGHIVISDTRISSPTGLDMGRAALLHAREPSGPSHRRLAGHQNIARSPISLRPRPSGPMARWLPCKSACLSMTSSALDRLPHSSTIDDILASPASYAACDPRAVRDANHRASGLVAQPSPLVGSPSHIALHSSRKAHDDASSSRKAFKPKPPAPASSGGRRLMAPLRVWVTPRAWPPKDTVVMDSHSSTGPRP